MKHRVGIKSQLSLKFYDSAKWVGVGHLIKYTKDTILKPEALEKEPRLVIQASILPSTPFSNIVFELKTTKLKNFKYLGSTINQLEVLGGSGDNLLKMVQG
ncbi:hypothetical protein L1887_14511 [Cichorium endivia]|nr:hypothetical protein L1887_14511 [Cichorium endivia]